MLSKLPPVASGRKVVRGSRPALAPITGNEDHSQGVKRKTTTDNSSSSSLSSRFNTRKTKQKKNTFDSNQMTLSNMWNDNEVEKKEEENFTNVQHLDATGEEAIIQLEDLIRITGPDLSYDANGKVINYTPAVDPISQLSIPQKRIYDMAIKGESFFFTGAAGTGKSYTLKRIIEGLKQKYFGKQSAVHVLGPTGAAACNIDGVTIHSFASLKPDDPPSIKSYIKHLDRTSEGGKRGSGYFVKQRWSKARVIIIDEISMVASKMLDFLDQAAKAIRKSSKPFGGIQLILCGDFCQLPPVNARYAFMAQCWNKAVKTSIELVENFRQNRDLEYAKALNEIRFGVYSVEAQDIIDTCSIPFEERNGEEEEEQDIPKSKDPGNVKEEDCDDDDDDDDDDDIKCTVLYSENRKVDAENMEKLRNLPGEFFVIHAKDHITKKKIKGRITVNRSESQIQFIRNKLEKIKRPPKEVVLKTGAQVILTKNLDTTIGLVNGARGVVKRFKIVAGEWMPVVKFHCGEKMTMIRDKFDIRTEDEVIAERHQIPLILGFACTIHKSQGMTLDLVRMSLVNCRSPGQVYTALSRASSTRGLYIEDFEELCIKTDPNVIKFYKSIHHVKLEELRLKRELKKKREKSPW